MEILERRIQFAGSRGIVSLSQPDPAARQGRSVVRQIIFSSRAKFQQPIRPRQLAPLTVKVAVRFKRFAKLADEIKKLTTLQRVIEMLFTRVHFAAIEM